MSDTKPWHDTPSCVVTDCGGPIVPFGGSGINPAAAPNASHVMCAACGHDFLLDPSTPDGLLDLARIWWSAGAYEGREETEREIEKERRHV